MCCWSTAPHGHRQGGPPRPALARARERQTPEYVEVTRPTRTSPARRARRRRRPWRASGPRCWAWSAWAVARQLFRAGRRLDPEHPGHCPRQPGRAAPDAQAVVPGAHGGRPGCGLRRGAWRRGAGEDGRTGHRGRGRAPDPHPALVLRAALRGPGTLEPGPLAAKRPGAWTPARLERAVSRLVAHHDALRLRFRETAEGWQQWHDAPEGPALLRGRRSERPRRG